MIIKIPNLDFSGNNLGNIGTVTEVQQKVAAILANYSTAFTPKQKIGVNNFVLGLKENQLWEKIGNLYIPALASNVSESLYNLKTGVVDAVPNATHYMLDKQGLRITNSSLDNVLPAAETATVKVNGSYMNIHYAVYMAEDPVYVDGGRTSHYFFTAINDSAYKGLRASYTKDNVRWNLIFTGNPDKYGQSYDKISGFVGASCGTDGKVYGISNKDYSTLGQTVTTDTTISNVPAYIGCHYNRSARCAIPMRLISMGSAMTELEMVKYNELCDALIASIC